MNGRSGGIGRRAGFKIPSWQQGEGSSPSSGICSLCVFRDASCVQEKTNRQETMKNLPDKISTVEELDELLSLPSEALVDFIRQLDGNIMVLGAGGKMGPTMSRMAKRAIDICGVKKEVIAVARSPLPYLASKGIKTIQCELLELDSVEKLPKTENIIYMAGKKFGTSGSESLTWAANVIVPYHIGRTFKKSRIVVFSTGCVYPLMDVNGHGATERTPPEPIGEYAISCLGRERMFDYFCDTAGLKAVHIRLNYAVEMRYGVIIDVATKVWKGEAVDVRSGFANVIWQGDACEQILRSVDLADSPAAILNITGPEKISIRELAYQFGEFFGKKVIIASKETSKAYLSNAAKAKALFGNPSVSLEKIIEWTAEWIKAGGDNLGKPTHFEVQDGKY